MSESPQPGAIVGAIGRLCFIRWSRRPTAAEARAVRDGMATARRSAGAPLVVIAIVQADSSIPDPSAIVEMLKATHFIDHAVESGVNVMEGDSIPTRLLRGSIQGVVSVLKTPWEFVDDCNVALEKVCRKLGLDVERTRSEAIARGLFPQQRSHGEVYAP